VYSSWYFSGSKSPERFLIRASAIWRTEGSRSTPSTPPTPSISLKAWSSSA